MPLDKNIIFKLSHRKKPLILITNDDGVSSLGIKTLAKTMKKVGNVLVVAPAVEQSASSHSLTLYRPLRCKRLANNVYAVDGTPTDCINLAMNFIVRDHPPDLIFSGINRGPNMGDDVHYSGTVSAAIEGGIMGIPSVAISVAGSLAHAFAGRPGFKFKAAANFAARVARKILRQKLPSGIILNINVPNIPQNKIKGCKVTFQGKKNYSDITTEKLDPRGERYYWISGIEAGFDDIPGSDCNAVAEGLISITPIRVNLTDLGYLKKVEKWKW